MSWNRHNCPDYCELQYTLPFSMKPMSRTCKWSLSSFLCDREVTQVSPHPRGSPHNLLHRPLKQPTSRLSQTKRRIFRVPIPPRGGAVTFHICTCRPVLGHMYKQPNALIISHSRSTMSLISSSADNDVRDELEDTAWLKTLFPLEHEWWHLFTRQPGPYVLHYTFYIKLIWIK